MQTYLYLVQCEYKMFFLIFLYYLSDHKLVSILRSFLPEINGNVVKNFLCKTFGRLLLTYIYNFYI